MVLRTFDGGDVLVTALGHHKDDYRRSDCATYLSGMNYIAPGKKSVKKMVRKSMQQPGEHPVKF